MLMLLLCDVRLMMIYVCMISSQPTSAGAPEKDQRSGTRTFRSWRLNPNIPTVRRRWYCEWRFALLPDYLCFCPFLIDLISLLVLFCDLSFFILLILCMLMFLSWIISLIRWFPTICLSLFPPFLYKNRFLYALSYIFHSFCLCTWWVIHYRTWTFWTNKKVACQWNKNNWHLKMELNIQHFKCPLSGPS